MTGSYGEEGDWSGKAVFSTGEAAQICKVSQQTIIRCFDSGRLQGFRVPGSKFRRIPREELIRFMRENGIPLSLLEGAVRRVLSVRAEGSALADVEAALGERGRVELCIATTSFDAGWWLGTFRPHLVVLDETMPTCTCRLVRERVDGVEEHERPVIARVRTGGGDEPIDGADAVVSLGAGVASVASALLALLDGGERDAGGDD